MRKITILGSTGSIGTQTLDVVRENKDITVVGISAGKNIRLLEQQIRETTKKNQDLEEDIANSDNPEMIEKIAREELDMVVQDERVFYHSGG